MGDRTVATAATATAAASTEAKNGPNLYTTKDGKQIEIRDVWEDNLEEEMANVRKLVDQYHYIGMDTEFPGIVAKPIGETFQPTDYRYQELRCNVDLLKIIQLGITFTDDQGNFVEGCPCFQFNFKFNLKEDMYAQDSIDLLMRSLQLALFRCLSDIWQLVGGCSTELLLPDTCVPKFNDCAQVWN